MKSELRGIMFVLISAISFGLMPIFARFAYMEGVEIPDLLLVRFLVAFLIMGVFLKFSNKRSIPAKKYLVLLLSLGGIGYFLQSIFYFSSLLYIPVSIASLILYTYPAFVVAGSMILGLERISIITVLSLTIALVGLFLVANPILNVAGIGIIIALGAAITYTVYILVSTILLKEVQGEIGSFFVMGSAGLSFLLSNLLTNQLQFDWTFGGWFWVLMIAVICTFIAITTFFHGIKIIGPSRSSILSSAELITSILIATIIFNDRLDFTQLIGSGLIFISTILVAFKNETRVP